MGTDVYIYKYYGFRLRHKFLHKFLQTQKDGVAAIPLGDASIVFIEKTFEKLANVFEDVLDYELPQDPVNFDWAVAIKQFCKDHEIEYQTPKWRLISYFSY